MKDRATPTESADLTFYTTKQVAEIFGVTGETVRDWITTGKITAVRLPSGHFRISRDAVKAFGSSTYESTPATGGAEVFL